MCIKYLLIRSLELEGPKTPRASTVGFAALLGHRCFTASTWPYGRIGRTRPDSLVLLFGSHIVRGKIKLIKAPKKTVFYAFEDNYNILYYYF